MLLRTWSNNLSADSGRCIRDWGLRRSSLLLLTLVHCNNGHFIGQNTHSYDNAGSTISRWDRTRRSLLHIVTIPISDIVSTSCRFRWMPDSAVLSDSLNYVWNLIKALYFFLLRRLWVVPREAGDPLELQQVGYVNVVPARSEVGTFDSFGDTVRKFNLHLRQRPLPG